jgi:23S rRNA pseudouridine2457 synthase
VNRYFIIYKPYKMISQFVSPYEQSKLCDLDFVFPPGTNAVGRLDDESEGLLILTNDKTLTKKLFDPEKKHKRNYIVQVEKMMGEEALKQLNEGIDILIKGQNRIYKTQACSVKIIDKPHFLPKRPESLREDLPQTWLEFILTEGKNRQIRKMCKAVRHKCKRLVRTKIEDLEIGNLQPGDVKEIEKEELFKLLKFN